MIKRIIKFILFFFVIISAGCIGDELADTREYVHTVLGRPGKPIPPIQQITNYGTFAYSAMDVRSPFEPPKLLTGEDSGPNNGLRPDINRVREPLESFPLDSLKMVGTLRRGDTRFAIVKDTSGVVYRVQVGNYLGQNFGAIQEITENQIKITEVVSDGTSGWRKRDATIVLGE